jgi:hypothetical protein
MSFVDSEFAARGPSVSRFYLAGLAASFIVFFACLVIFSGVALFGESGSPAVAVGILLAGGFWGVLLTGLLAFLIIAPIGTAIGLALARFAPPGYWQGPANGALVATLVIGSYVLAASPEETWPGMAGAAIAAGFVAIGAAAGWMAQRWFLRWPDPLADAEPD